MNLELESTGIWSTVVQRRTETIIRPGAPLRITSVALPFALNVPTRVEKGLYRSVLQMSYRERGASEYEGSVTLAVLVPEKTEFFECGVDLYPGYEYVFQVVGNNMHLLGEFFGEEFHGKKGKGPAFPKTQIREIISAPKRSASQASDVKPANPREWKFSG
ncbi:hypothetical protein EST38_g12798 [Candolleomyces aberdarensis]|uniref:Nucleoplasmin-like domain-containing protein n=1 Tax=Candolleomyces aberdarensis TaxID=2316362 RepID=A0A4Q2D4I0_9AGAR|nr:hypothetical protein EST38_g12798 [Candolleomyces aberdarensis]